MKKVTLLVAALGLISLASCSKCVKCKVVYTEDSGNYSSGEEHTNEICDGTLEEAETVTGNLEAAGQIESGWSCK